MLGSSLLCSPIVHMRKDHANSSPDLGQTAFLDLVFKRIILAQDSSSFALSTHCLVLRLPCVEIAQQIIAAATAFNNNLEKYPLVMLSKVQIKVPW